MLVVVRSAEPTEQEVRQQRFVFDRIKQNQEFTLGRRGQSPALPSLYLGSLRRKSHVCCGGGFLGSHAAPPFFRSSRTLHFIRKALFILSAANILMCSIGVLPIGTCSFFSLKYLAEIGRAHV